MIRILVWTLGCLVWAVPALAGFPDVPVDVTPIEVADSNTRAHLYAWSQGGNLYVHIDPITDRYYIRGNKFRVAQGCRFDGPGILLCDDGRRVDTIFVYTPATFQLSFGVEQTCDPNVTIVLVYHAATTYILEISPAYTAVVPTNGIWESADGQLLLYIQKYMTQSCILIATMGDQVHTVFMDTDFTNGICAWEIYGNGYDLCLSLSDAAHGTVTVTLPGFGTVTKDVALKYEDFG